jgi:DNA helicase II / ATP-dependent DNA helicase PcrA
VHVLNVVDGCMPADMATGDAAQIEEERRLLYVAMTRARDELTLWTPQRFYVTQQRALGGQHLYALRTRFIPPELLQHFDLRPPHALQAGGEARQEAGAEPYFDIAAALRSSWTEKAQPASAKPTSN